MGDESGKKGKGKGKGKKGKGKKGKGKKGKGGGDDAPSSSSPELTPVGTNCNCGKRVEKFAKSKTAETCNDACDSNPSCKSFGFWTGEKAKGYCALFDKACSCDGKCSGDP